MNPAFDIAAFRFEDPFGSSADPARYVPREATERALAQLEERVIEQRRSSLLAGVPGIGKTLLLRILRTRFSANTSVAHLRYPALPAAALFSWALAELEGPTSYDPVGALVSLAADRANQGGDIVLLVDDAETLPDDTALALYQACELTHGALRFVAAGDRESMGRLAGQIHESDPVLLVDPMTQEETNAYVAAHISAGGLTAAAHDTFGSAELAQLQATTGGLPARVNAEASRMLRRSLGPRFASPAARSEARADGPQSTAPGELQPTPAAAPLAAPSQAGPGDSAALERAAGRLALAQADVRQPGPVDAALERAAGRLALANAAAAAAEGGADDRAETEAEAGSSDARAAAASTPPPVSRDQPTTKPRRREPPLSLSAGVFVGCLAAGALFGASMLNAPPANTPPPEPELPTPPQLSEPVAPPPVSAPPPQPVLEPVAVQINARPWAEIYVDGKIVGVTPLAGVLLTPGPHRFEARFPTGEIETHTLEIDPEHRHLAFPLADAAPATAQ